MDSFIVIHIQDKNYFTNIDLGDERCVKMIEAKLRQEGFENTAKLIKANKTQIKDFFKKQNWTVKNMTGFDWFKNKWGNTCYGIKTNKNLSNSHGVKISEYGVQIAYFNK